MREVDITDDVRAYAIKELRDGRSPEYVAKHTRGKFVGNDCTNFENYKKWLYNVYISRTYDLGPFVPFRFYIRY